MGTLTIGDVAEQAGVNIETLRYYERRGIVPPPRTNANYRLYPGDTVQLVRFVKRAQDLGFYAKRDQGTPGVPGRQQRHVRGRSPAGPGEDCRH